MDQVFRPSHPHLVGPPLLAVGIRRVCALVEHVVPLAEPGDGLRTHVPIVPRPGLSWRKDRVPTVLGPMDHVLARRQPASIARAAVLEMRAESRVKQCIGPVGLSDDGMEMDMLAVEVREVAKREDVTGFCLVKRAERGSRLGQPYAQPLDVALNVERQSEMTVGQAHYPATAL